MAIPPEVVREVRERTDIAEVISRYVTLKRRGSSIKGLCPFHQEKTPSFNVNMDRQIFHCFGCGEGGNVITFLVKHENLTFPEAVRMLASELGIEVPETDRRDRGETEKLFVALEEASRCFQEQLSLPSGKLAMDYLEFSEESSSTALAYAMVTIIGSIGLAWVGYRTTLELMS